MKFRQATIGSVTAAKYLLITLLLVYSHSLTAESFISLEISKSERTLKVIQGDEIIRHYQVAFGKGGKGSKKIMGDNKTPIGKYRIMEFRADSKFHYFMQIDYPNLIDAWHGYKDRLITGSEFREIATAYRDSELPPQDTLLGGYIGIHGIGPINRKKLNIHSLHDWTEGCIALKNEEISELRNYVSIGTPVLITE